ncbi:MAG TPA: Fe-S cluster assembly protein SufD [Saprospiraceae bacterium]|nr:Fe-S cluster assembly protein SufD [Saprospiraceae bacterium]
MTGQDAILDHLTTLFREHEASLNGRSASAYHRFQQNSFRALGQLTFPDRKNEDWKYTSVQKLLAPKYTIARSNPNLGLSDIPGLTSYVITCTNGQLDPLRIAPGLISKGVKVIPLSEAINLPSWTTRFESRINMDKANSNQTFDLLNFSFNANGFFIDIPDGLILDAPIEVRIIHDDTTLAFSHPLYFIHAGQLSQVTLFERFEHPAGNGSLPTEGLINTLVMIHVDKGGQFRHIKWQDLPPSQSMVYQLKVIQQQDSHFETLAFDHGGQTIRNNVEADMVESNTYTSLLGGYMAKGKQSMDHQTKINHHVHHCESHEQYKGIVDDQASAAFNGKVYVHPDAQKTNAYQQNDTLVLSPNAVMNSKPQLEIFADDVKCSHGATIGQMDERALFYLQSRGLKPEQARSILKSAFLAQIIDLIPDEIIREYIADHLSITL